MPRKADPKTRQIESGSWVGVSPRCRLSFLVNNWGDPLTEDQIERLRRGSMIALEERYDFWLVWDIEEGNEAYLKIPTRLLQVRTQAEVRKATMRPTITSEELFCRTPVDPDLIEIGTGDGLCKNDTWS